jgi:hypothetical protein
VEDYQLECGVRQVGKEFMRAKEFVEEGIIDKVKSLFGPKNKITLNSGLDGYSDELWVKISKDDYKIGNFTFNRSGKNLEAEDIWVKPSQRGKGITKMVYDTLKSRGFNIQRSRDQTDDGAHFWNKNRPGSTAGTVWEQNVTEGKSL